MTEGLHHVGDLLGALVLDAALFARLEIGGERLAAFLDHAGNVLGETLDIDAGRRRQLGAGSQGNRLGGWLGFGRLDAWVLQLWAGGGVHGIPCFGHITRIAGPRATNSWGHMGIWRRI